MFMTMSGSVTKYMSQRNPLGLSYVNLSAVDMSQSKKAYCAKHPKEGRCNAESITVANTYMRTVTRQRRPVYTTPRPEPFP